MQVRFLQKEIVTIFDYRITILSYSVNIILNFKYELAKTFHMGAQKSLFCLLEQKKSQLTNVYIYVNVFLYLRWQWLILFTFQVQFTALQMTKLKLRNNIQI